MSDIVVTERVAHVDASVEKPSQRWQLHINGRRIPSAFAGEMNQLGELIIQANTLLQNAQQEAHQLKSHAYEAGWHQGREEGWLSMTDSLLAAHAQNQRFLQQSEARIVRLVMAALHHLLPKIPRDQVMENLVSASLQAVRADRYIVIAVHPCQLGLAQAQAAEWRALVPGVKTFECIADATLQPTDCVVTSEWGEVRAGVNQQLDSLDQALQVAAQRDIPHE